MRKLSIGLIVLIHLSWLFMLLVSLPLVIIYPHYSLYVLYIVGFTLLVQFIFWGCPLTIVENKLRGQHAYPEKTFLRHYLKVLFNIHVSDRFVDVVTACYFVMLITVSVLRFF